MPSLVSSGDLLKLDKTTEDTEKHRVKNKKTLSSLWLKITIDLSDKSPSASQRLAHDGHNIPAEDIERRYGLCDLIVA